MDPTVMDWRMQILGAVATGLLAVITACVPIIARAAVRFLEQRLALALTDAERVALQHEAERAVAWVEEQSRKELKRRGIPLPSDTKLRIAVDAMRDALIRQGFGDVARWDMEHVLRQAVEAHLGQTRPWLPADPPISPPPSAGAPLHDDPR